MGVVYLKLVRALFICYLFDHPIHDAAKPTFLEAFFSHVSRSTPPQLLFALLLRFCWWHYWFMWKLLTCSSDPFWNWWDCSAAVANNTITARFYMACRPQASPDEHGGRMQWVIPQPFRLWATRLLCTTWTWLIAASRLLVVNFAFNLRIGTPRRELCSFKMMRWIRYGHDQSFILLYNMIVRLFRRQWHKHSFLMGLLGTAVHLGRARKRRMYQLHDWPSIFFSIAPPSSHY